MKRSLLLILVLALICIAMPVSAAVLNLTNPYATDSALQQNENVRDGWNTALNNSAIIWLSFFNMPTNVNINFTLISNDGSQIQGYLQSADTLPWQSTLTVSLGGVTNTTVYGHFPFLGITPTYTLTYGVDSQGYNYLVFIPESMTGVPTESCNGAFICSSTDATKSFTIDTTLDPNVMVNPATITPVIQFNVQADRDISIWGYWISIAELKKVLSQSPDSNNQNILSTFGTAWSLGSGGLGFFLTVILPNLPLIIMIGDGLLFVYYVDRKGLIGGSGEWVEKNMVIFDLLLRFYGYLIMFLWAVVDFFKPKL